MIQRPPRNVVGGKQNTPELDSLPHVSGKSQQLRGNPDCAVRRYIRQCLHRPWVVADRAEYDTFTIEAAQRLREKITDASLGSARQKNQYAIARTRQRHHSMVEKIDYQFLILRSESNPLGFSGGSRARQCHDSRDVAWRNTEQIAGPVSENAGSINGVLPDLNALDGRIHAA